VHQKLPLLDDIMRMEFTLMKKFITRSGNFAGKSLSFFIAADHKFIDGRRGKYVRSLEFGTFVGLAQKLFPADSTIHDVIMTFDDEKSLSSAKMKIRRDDAKDAKLMWSTLWLRWG
jgi:hypothetical protein